MQKIFKKMIIAVLFVSMMLQCSVMSTSAAVQGKMSLQVPNASVGEVVNVKVNTVVDAGVTTVKFTLDYDPNLLEFVSAQNTQEINEGRLEYNCDVNRNSMYSGHQVDFTFKTLDAGDAKLAISSYDIKSYTEIAWTTDAKTMKITGGETQAPESTPEEQAPSQEPTENDETKTEEQEQEPTVDNNEEVNDDVTESGQIYISENVYITVLKEKPLSSFPSFPERYVETTVKIEGVEYPAWQDSENTDTYLLYAKSSVNGKSLYSYDITEQTYQRFELEIEKDVTEQENKNLDFSNITFYISVVLSGLLLIAIVAIICLIAKNKKLDEEVFDLVEENEELEKKLKSTNSTKKVVHENLEEDLESIVEKSLKETMQKEQLIKHQQDEDFEVKFIDLDD